MSCINDVFSQLRPIINLNINSDVIDIDFSLQFYILLSITCLLPNQSNAETDAWLRYAFYHRSNRSKFGFVRWCRLVCSQYCLFLQKSVELIHKDNIFYNICLNFIVPCQIMSNLKSVKSHPVSLSISND